MSLKRQGDGYKRAKAEKALGRDMGFGTCARCGHYDYVNGHERLGRAQGGDPTRPDCLLCVPCNTWCEDNPVWAAYQGWKISGKSPRAIEIGPNQAWRLDGNLHTFSGSE